MVSPNNIITVNGQLPIYSEDWLWLHLLSNILRKVSH